MNDENNPHTHYIISKENSKKVSNHEIKDNNNQFLHSNTIKINSEEPNKLVFSTSISQKNTNQVSTTSKTNTQPQTGNTTNTPNNNLSQNPSTNKSGGKTVINVQGNSNVNTSTQNQTGIVNQIKLEKDSKANTTTSKFQNLTINTGNGNLVNNQLNTEKKLPSTTKNEANKPKIFQNIQVNLKNVSPKNISSKK